MATAYVALGLLAVTLAIGPINLLRGRRNPLSIDLRRDIGIWCAVVSLAHVVVGLQVHMGNMLLYFFRPADTYQRWTPRLDFFGLANYAGLLGTLIVLLLLCLSNDVAVRSLGRWRWKFWQRSSYMLAVVVVLHAIAYQVLERREAPYLILFGVIVAAAATVQVLGFRWHRKQDAQVTSQRRA